MSDHPDADVEATDSPGSEPLDMSAYLEQVHKEIDEEVRRRRAAGDFPLSFERKLDALFGRFTPLGTDDTEFEQALKLADRASTLDLGVPLGPGRSPRGAAKRVLWRAEAWFFDYVIRQANHFNASIVRTAQLLDDRLLEVERQLSLLVPPPTFGTDADGPWVDPLPFAGALVTSLKASGGAPARILHTECGDGSLVAALCAEGLDGYGVEPSAGVVRAIERGDLDIQVDDPVAHLRAVGDETLAGLVLSGCVDRFALPHQRELVGLAERKVATGGVVAVIGTVPECWRTVAGPVRSDLAPGRPLHPETWAHLFAESGLAGAQTSPGPPGPAEAPASFLVLASK
jgi:hypothetical protein